MLIKKKQNIKIPRLKASCFRIRCVLTNSLRIFSVYFLRTRICSDRDNLFIHSIMDHLKATTKTQSRAIEPFASSPQSFKNLQCHLLISGLGIRPYNIVHFTQLLCFCFSDSSYFAYKHCAFSKRLALLAPG